MFRAGAPAPVMVISMLIVLGIREPLTGACVAFARTFTMRISRWLVPGAFNGTPDHSRELLLNCWPWNTLY